MLSQLEKCQQWWTTTDSNLDATQYCMTRDVFEGRLSKLPAFLTHPRNSNFSNDDSFLLTAVIGEIANNSFDHNLGHWNGEPGIYFGYEIKNNKDVIIWVADKGRGIAASLGAVHHEITNDKIALEAAFSKKISGRYPEKRGNGLKFVRQVINCDKPRGLWCKSGTAYINFGHLGDEASHPFSVNKGVEVKGTFTLVLWGKHA